MKQFNIIGLRLVTLLGLSVLGLSLTAVLTVAMASTSQIYIDDLDFDYSLDSLVTSADSYDGYTQAFTYNGADNQAENVAVYVQFGTFHPSGELRIYVDSGNDLNSSLPVAMAIVPDGSNGVEDLSGGFEVFTKAGEVNKDVGLKLNVSGESLEDVVSSYMDNLSALDYAVTPVQAAGTTSYAVSKKYANYLLSFKQSGASVEVNLKGM